MSQSCSCRRHPTFSPSFTDKQVLAPSFMDKLMEVASAIRPLVHWINDAIAIPPEGPAEEE